MPDPIVYGFPRSTYVNIVRLILTHKNIPYAFHDLEPVMGKPSIWLCIRSIAYRSSGMEILPSTRPAPSPPISMKRLMDRD